MKIFQSLIVLLGSLLLENNKGPTYNVLMQDKNFELRQYTAWIVAQTVVQSTHEEAGNDAFHILAGYIFGKNDKKVKIEMTAPVTQFEVSPGNFAVQFMMPVEWTLETLPKPDDSRVALKTIPSRNLIVVRYHGGWSDRSYIEQLASLQNEAKTHGIKLKDQSRPIWARYNSPMAPSPIRTNEIMYETQ